MSQGDQGGQAGAGGSTRFPRCRECDEGELVPLSDFGGQGASVMYKAWVCVNPSCGFNIKIRNGEVMLNEPVTDAHARPAAARAATALVHGRAANRSVTQS
jgi:hypothetical protein